MCECGCAEQLHPQFQFKGPDGLVYCVALAEGCPDCEGPAGVMLLRMQESILTDEEGIFREPSLPELPWFDRGGWSEVYLPIIGQESLRQALTQSGLDEFDAEESSDCYKDAAWAEIAKWRARNAEDAPK